MCQQGTALCHCVVVFVIGLVMFVLYTVSATLTLVSHACGRCYHFVYDLSWTPIICK